MIALATSSQILADLERLAQELLLAAFDGELPAAGQFLAGLWSSKAPMKGVGIARSAGINKSTLTSRFFRAGLPSPKRYAATTQLIRAVALLGEGSGAEVALELGYSSPQHLSRHLRHELGCTVVQARSGRSAVALLDDFIESMVEPFTAELRALRFQP